jgi:hypothetical protein
MKKLNAFKALKDPSHRGTCRRLVNLIGKRFGLGQGLRDADGITMLSHESIELASIWQAWKRRSQVMLPIAVKRSFALKLHPLSKERQSDHLVSLQRSQRSRFLLLLRKCRLAKIIHHDVQCLQECIQVHQEPSSFSYEVV